MLTLLLKPITKEEVEEIEVRRKERSPIMNELFKFIDNADLTAAEIDTTGYKNISSAQSTILCALKRMNCKTVKTLRSGTRLFIKKEN